MSPPFLCVCTNTYTLVVLTDNMITYMEIKSSRSSTQCLSGLIAAISNKSETAIRRGREGKKTDVYLRWLFLGTVLGYLDVSIDNALERESPLIPEDANL